MNHSSVSSASESMDDSITIPNPLDDLPSVPVEFISELKTLSKVAARDPNEETEDETLADLDQLQWDLERLLSSCVLMTRNLQCKIEGISDSNLDESVNGGRVGTSGLRGRRKRSRINAYIKRRRGGGAVSTPKINVEIVPELPSTATVAPGTPVKAGTVNGTNGKTPVKLNGAVNGTHTTGKTPNKSHTKESRSSSLCYIPKNNSAEIFWQSARVYVDPVGDADVKLIEDMLKRYENDDLPDIPALGEHYISDPSQLVSSLKKFKTSSNSADDSLVLRSEHILLNNNLQLPSNLIQHIVSVLNQQCHNGDENEVPNLESTGTPLVEDSKAVLSGGDAEVSSELVPLNGDMHCDNEDDEEDEVLAEIHKCRNELNLVSSENSRMLTSLLSKLVLESRRNKVKQKLEAIDSELCSIVRKMNSARNLAANTTVLNCPQGSADTEHVALQAKIRRYRKRSLLYLKMRACIVPLLESFNSDQAAQFTDSMDIDAYLLKHILEGEEISMSPSS